MITRPAGRWHGAEPRAHPRATDPRRGGAPWTRSPQDFCSAYRTTESDLTRARETGDDFLAEVEQAELDDLHRLAAEHGVEVGATSV